METQSYGSRKRVLSNKRRIVVLHNDHSSSPAEEFSTMTILAAEEFSISGASPFHWAIDGGHSHVIEKILNTTDNVR